MKKRVLSLALVVLMLLTLMPTAAFAKSATSGRYISAGVTYTLKDGVLTVSGKGVCSEKWQSRFDTAAVTEAVIENRVTSIGESAFANCSGLTSVSIPNSVTSIGDWAFEFCSSLTSISIPDSVTSIGYHAFSDCSALTEISVSPENPSYLSIDGVLYNKEKTELIQCPGAKSGSISIPDGVTSIGDSAFSGCGGLESITIPDSVTSIGDWAFNACSVLASISIPNSVTSIGHDAFGFCSSLESISIPDGVTSIGSGTFNACSALASITIPDSVTSIGDDAFYGCSALASIIIPDSVTSIGEYAFCECSALTSITIPDSVTSIGDYAFNACGELADVYYSGTEEQWNAISIGEDNGCLTDATIHYSKQETEHTHDTELKNAKEATCTEAGYTGDEVCKTCGETIKAGAEIEALGHDYKDGVCTVCGAEKPTISFSDVPSTAYYAAPVAWAVEKGITGGYSDNTFRPMNTCTRAQTVTFIWRAMGSPEPAGTGAGFNDVPKDMYYYKAVLWASENGITSGFDDGGFHPDELVTRAQAMTFLWRAEGKPAVPAGTVNTFVDVPEGAYYHDAVLWAVANGVTGGYDSRHFGSMDGCTRAQIVTFLYCDMAE